MGIFIFVRVVLSVTANALQKRLLLDRAGVGHTWVLTYSMMLLPAIIWALPLPRGAEFWQNVAIGGVLDALGNLAMVAALRSTDISVFGPLNAVRPILALMFGWMFLREAPTAVGLAGIAVTVGGGVILFSENSAPRAERAQAPQPAGRGTRQLHYDRCIASRPRSRQLARRRDWYG